MRKKVLIGILLFAVSLFIVPQAFAVDPNKMFVCLNAARCDQDGSGCTDNDSHKVKLTTKEDRKALPNAETYVVEVLATARGPAYSAGVANSQLFGNGNAFILREINYEFQGMFRADGRTEIRNPVTSNNAGIIGPYEWRSYTPDNLERKFYSLNIYDPSQTAVGNIGGQQQGTFAFDPNSRDCISISWDPYGRVFDSQSLEPVPGAQVTLRKKEGTGFRDLTPNDVLGGDLVNPQTTNEDGAFSFVVPDDTYKLFVSRAEYVFPNILTKLNAAYSRIYSDIYRDEEIVQRGAVQHRDIPIDSTTPGGKTYPLKVHYFYESNSAGKAIVEGKASHPLVSIKAYSQQIKPQSNPLREPQKVRGRLLKTIRANQDGKFLLEVDLSELAKNEVFGEVEVSKTDLTQLISSNNLPSILRFIVNRINVFADETTLLKFEPIPAYIEGKSYTNNGQVMPEATVGVYLEFSDKPFYETKADQDGRFVISSEYLPKLPYKLRYSNQSGQRVEVTTSKYIAQNSDYITSNDVEINSYKDNQGNTQPSGSDLKPSGTSSPSGLSQQKSNVSTPQSAMFLTIAVILILLGVSMLLLGFYLYRKNKTSNSSQM